MKAESWGSEKTVFRNEQGKGWRPDPYSLKIAEAVCAVFINADVETLLELGPGRGNYTLRLAAICRQLICVDSSKDVQVYIRKIAAEHNIANITTLLGKWRDSTPFQCDGVFAYNCFYGMTEIERCLMKIHESARKICIIGMNSGPEQPYFQDFEQKLGLKVRYTREDSHNLKKGLRNLGITPSIEINLPNEREYAYDTFDELLEYALSKVIGSYDEQAVKEILRHHFFYRDGKYRCIHKFSSDLICWLK